MAGLDIKTTGHIICSMNTTKDNKRSTIITAGADLMLRKGYHGTGIQEIVDGAGVPKGSFYNYFKSKEDFALAAMEAASRDHICGFETALADPGKSPRRQAYRSKMRRSSGGENREIARAVFSENLKTAGSHAGFVGLGFVLFCKNATRVIRNQAPSSV